MVDVQATGRGHDASVSVAPGGSAANAAVWATACGADATVIGRIGDDPAGRMVLEELRTRGVAAELSVDPAAPTGAVVVGGFATGADSDHGPALADRGANARFSADDVPAAIEADAVLVSGYLLLHRDASAGARAAIERARAAWIAVDAASAALVEARGRERFFELTAGASVLLANDEEARVLAGAEPKEAVRALGRRYRLACVKQGAAGAVGCLDGRTERASAPAVEGVGALGAGDAFAAALLVALAGGAGLADALAEACRCGALAVASPAAWPAAQAVLSSGV